MFDQACLTKIKKKKKKKVIAQETKNFPRNFMRSPKKKRFLQIFREVSGVLRDKVKKKGHGHGPFLTIQKIVLFSAEDKAFSKICRLRGQGLDHRIQAQGLQNVSSRTPTLLNVLFTSCF